MGVMAPHVVSDRCSDPLRVRQNVVVPKAQDAETLAPQEVCSAGLSFRFAVMLTAIDLDDQLDLVSVRSECCSGPLARPTTLSRILLLGGRAGERAGHGLLKRTLTDEIGDIASDRNLATKPATIQLTLTEHSQQRALRICHLAPQRPCPSNGVVDRMFFHPPFCHRHDHPHPTLPHQGGGLQGCWSHDCRQTPSARCGSSVRRLQWGRGVLPLRDCSVVSTGPLNSLLQ